MVRFGRYACHAIFYDIAGTALSYFQVGKTRTVDLWLLDGVPEVSSERRKGISVSCGATVWGQITERFNSHEVRADCGIIDLDISSEQTIDIAVGTYITVQGSLQAFLPDLSKEGVWFSYD